MLIGHLTDLSSDDDVAFVLSVALAARSGARLASIHACVGPTPARELPHVAPVLARWSLQVEIEHDRIQHECCDDVTNTLLDALRRIQPDLVIASTHPRGWLARVVFGSVAEGVARNLRTPTLLLPIGGSCFADEANGKLGLERLLVPAGDAEDARSGIAAARFLARLCGSERAEIVVVHAGGALALPSLEVEPSLSVRSCSYAAPLEEAVQSAVRELDPDVIVMGTRGHDTLGDVLLGSHTERVLHEARRPVLWFPLDNRVS